MRRKCIFNTTFRIYLLSTQYYSFPQNIYHLNNKSFSRVRISRRIFIKSYYAMKSNITFSLCGESSCIKSIYVILFNKLYSTFTLSVNSHGHNIQLISTNGNSPDSVAKKRLLCKIKSRFREKQKLFAYIGGIVRFVL